MTKRKTCSSKLLSRPVCATPSNCASPRLACGVCARTDDLAKLTNLSDLRDTTYTVEQRTRCCGEISDTWYRLGVWNRAETLWCELARTLPKDLRSRFALMELALKKNQPGDARKWAR